MLNIGFQTAETGKRQDKQDKIQSLTKIRSSEIVGVKIEILLLKMVIRKVGPRICFRPVKLGAKSPPMIALKNN